MTGAFARWEWDPESESWAARHHGVLYVVTPLPSGNGYFASTRLDTCCAECLGDAFLTLADAFAACEQHGAAS